MEGGRWVTINGTHVYIKDGQSPMDAFIRQKSGSKIHTYSTDAYSGQVNMVKEIRDSNDNVIAKLEYSEFEGKAYIDMIETTEKYKRQGLATKLLDDLRKEYGDNIEYGYSTQEGTKFLNAYFKKRHKGGNK